MIALARAVLFDLDDTLFDHHRSARAALAEVHRRHADATDFDSFERHHIRFLEEMHIEVLAGRVELNEARRERFRRVFRALGLQMSEADVDAVASAYRSGYVAARRPVEGAADLLAAVRPHARIGIVSNNLVEEQRDKLAYCGLAPFVDALVVSEEAGVSKPDPSIFRLALDRLGVQASEAVMVGDSWAADIVGAARAGVRAIWFNPFRKAMPAEPAGVAEIHALAPAVDLLPLLLGAEHVGP
ncbi:MAG TPA: HAD-IA family hydrolase [Vicinamibacterales bacterium]|nr:HAD-IA family hydrolase [Vicinamibacterales bacterium]